MTFGREATVVQGSLYSDVPNGLDVVPRPVGRQQYFVKSLEIAGDSLSPCRRWDRW